MVWCCNEVAPLLSPCRPSGPNKSLKLVSKGKDVDNFVDKLKSEGVNVVTPLSGRKQSDASKALPPPVNTERYHTSILKGKVRF